MIEATIGRILTEKSLSLATAESFTGGRLAEQITAIPGASAYFKGSIVSYATAVKTDLLRVDPELVDRHSVVSAEVASAMAENVKKLLNADFSMATTGNAGPSKGDSDAEIGTVYLAVSGPKGTVVEGFNMGNHRKKIVQKAVNKVFQMLLKEIANF